jgi:hypothetical protein
MTSKRSRKEVLAEDLKSLLENLAALPEASAFLQSQDVDWTEADKTYVEGLRSWKDTVESRLSLDDRSEDAEAWRKATSTPITILNVYDYAERMRILLQGIVSKLDEETNELVGQSLLDMDIVRDTRDYVENIAVQVNGCYEKGWYDACAVMVRRLIEILIVDSFKAKDRLGDIRAGSHTPPTKQISKHPTSFELVQFLEGDFPRLEEALRLILISGGRSPLTKPSATSSWSWVTSRFNVPENIDEEFSRIVETRELAQGGVEKLTGKRLFSAKQGINQVMEFLNKQFPDVGIQLPPAGVILSLGHLIERYLEADGNYWHIERKAKPALKKIKEIGDIGAHGYAKVTKQKLEKYQDELFSGIQQLVRTAYQES